MGNMFWMATTGLVLAMFLMMATLNIVQLSARVHYIPMGNQYVGDYTVTGVTKNNFTFIGGVNVTGIDNHRGAALALRAWAFRRGALIKTIVHTDTATVVWQRK